MINASLLLVAMMTGAAGEVPVSAPAGSCQIVAPQLDVSAGQEIRVPILLKGAPEFAAMEVDITYDPAVVEPLGADLGPLGTNMLIDVGLAKSGLVVMSLAGARGGPKGDGELLAVRFRVKDAAGQASPLEFKHVRAWRSDNELEVPIEPVAGRLVVASAGLSRFPWGWIALAVCGGIIALVAAIVQLRRRSSRPAPVPLPGAPRAAAFCSNCGAALVPGAKFCGQCGKAASPPGAAS